jgi:hypothetical protein
LPLHRRAGALRSPVQVIETAGDFRGKGHHGSSSQFNFGTKLNRLKRRPGNHGIKFSGASLVDFEPKRDQKVLERFSVHCLSPFRYSVIVIGFEVQPVIHAGNISQVD